MLSLFGSILGVIVLGRPVWGLFLCFSVLPLLEYSYGGFAGSRSPATFPTLCVGIAVLLRVLIFDKEYRRRLLLLLLLVLTFVAASAAHLGTVLRLYPQVISGSLFDDGQLNPFVFFAEGLLWFLAGLLFLGVAKLGTRKRNWAVLYGALITQGVVFLGVLVVDALIHGKGIPGYWVRHSQENQAGLYAVFGDHNAFGAYCLIQAFLAAGLLFSKESLVKWGGFLLTALWVTMVALSVSISSILSLILTVCLGLALYWAGALGSRTHPGGIRPSDGRRGLKWVAMGTVLLFLGSAAYFSMDPVLRQRMIDRRFEELQPASILQSFKERRWTPWVAALAMTREHPVFGIGLGRYYSEFGSYREIVPEAERGFLFNQAPHENAHNYFLQLLAEAGVLGLLLFCGAMAIVLIRCDWAQRRAAAAGLGLFGILAVSVLQHPLLVEIIFFTAAGIAGLCWSSRKPGESSIHPILDRWIPGLLLVALLILPFDVYRVWDDSPCELEYGLFPPEQGADGPFTWTSGLALIRHCRQAQTVDLRFSTFEPGIEYHPLKVTIELDGKPRRRLTLSDHEWQQVHLDLRPGSLLAIVPSRTFRPAGDPRELGVVVQFLSPEASRERATE